MAEFEPAFDRTVRQWEGFERTDHPGDYGRQTYAGISRRTWPGWPGWALLDDGNTVPESQVAEFYRAHYWDVTEGDALRHQSVAQIIFDWAVNAGAPKAVRLTLDVLGLPPGLGMLSAVRELNNLASPRLFVCEYVLQRIAHRVAVVERDPSQIKWLRGWIARDLFFVQPNE